MDGKRERDVAGGVKWETCVCAVSGRESERERAQVCERMRWIDGPSDCHLAFDRQRERVRETQLGSCQDLSTELYQSANSHGRRQRWRCKEREKFNNLTFPPKAERDRASELCSGEENSCKMFHLICSGSPFENLSECFVAPLMKPFLFSCFF